jgi:hypothetical protein
MKKKKFKIRETTCFVFRAGLSVNSANDTTKTDPTTTTTTTITTGIYPR